MVSLMNFGGKYGNLFWTSWIVGGVLVVMYAYNSLLIVDGGLMISLLFAKNICNGFIGPN